MSGLTKEITSGLRLAIECRLMLKARCTFICSIIQGPVKTPFAQAPKGRRDKWLSVSSMHMTKCMAGLQVPSALQESATNFKAHASILALLASSPTLQAFPTLAAHSLYNPAILTMLTPFVFLFPSFRLSSFPTHFVPASLMERSSLLSCSVYNFLSLLWAVPDASGCSLSYIYNKTFP